MAACEQKSCLREKANAQPRKSGFVTHAVNACCVGAVLLYAVQRPMPDSRGTGCQKGQALLHREVIGDSGNHSEGRGGERLRGEWR